MNTATLKVAGMSCGHCAKAVEGAVAKLGASASVELASGKVTVSHDEARVPLAAIIDAIKKLGYEVA